MPPAIGHQGRFERIVGDTDTAHALGNPGVHVLATPRLAEFCEDAAHVACQTFSIDARHLRIDIRHLAATPKGERIEITATLTGIDPERLMFDIEGRDGRQAIVSGRVELRR